MTRKKKIIRNLIIIFAVLFIFFNTSGLYLSPVSAHELSERSHHYGPSEIKHIESAEDGKYFLCKYDKWISCDYIQKTLLFMWSIGSSSTGVENDISKGFVYAIVGNSEEINCNFLYGNINNQNITKIEIIFKDGDKSTQTKFYDGMYIFIWRGHEFGIKSVNGYDSDNNLIYSDNRT